MRGWTWARAARWSIGLGAVFVWLGWSGRSSAFGLRLLVVGSLMVAVPVGLWLRRALGSSRRAARGSTEPLTVAMTGWRRGGQCGATRAGSLCAVG